MLTVATPTMAVDKGGARAPKAPPPPTPLQQIKGLYIMHFYGKHVLCHVMHSLSISLE